VFGLSELAILLIVVIVLVGIRKLPGLARSAGTSLRILKSEARAMKRDGAEAEPRAVYEVKQTPPESGPDRPL
jgi:sec-independent protein translocase protein TatA